LLRHLLVQVGGLCHGVCCWGLSFAVGDLSQWHHVVRDLVVFVWFLAIPACAFLLPCIEPMLVGIFGPKYVVRIGVVVESAIFGFIIVTAAATRGLL